MHPDVYKMTNEIKAVIMQQCKNSKFADVLEWSQLAPLHKFLLFGILLDCAVAHFAAIVKYFLYLSARYLRWCNVNLPSRMSNEALANSSDEKLYNLWIFRIMNSSRKCQMVLISLMRGRRRNKKIVSGARDAINR